MVTFDDFVSEQGDGLAKLAYLLCGDRGHAEDLAQTSLMKAYKSWDRIGAMESPLAYVRKIVTREHVSWRRRLWTSEVASDQTALLTDNGSTARDDPAQSIVEIDAAWRLLRTLSKRQRSVLVLRFYLDLSDGEIADLLGCSPGTVRSHASRGLETLRQRVQTKTKEPLP